MLSQNGFKFLADNSNLGYEEEAWNNGKIISV